MCVTFGARLRWAPVSVCLAFQTACGAQEQCPESGFDLGRHVWSTAGGTDALSGAGDAHGFHGFIGSRAGQCFQVSVEAFFLPMAALVPLSNRMRRTTSPMTAMISGLLKRLWQEATYGSAINVQISFRTCTRKKNPTGDFLKPF